MSVPGFHAERAEHAFGVANGTASPTILATPTDAGAAVAYAPADAAGTTDGYQVAVSPGATVTVTITVTAAGGATQNYELTIGRGLTGDFQWKAVDDFYTPAHADVTFYRDIWSDGEIMYLAAPDSDNKRILAFNMDTKEIIPGRQLDLATLTPGHGTNRSPQGVWGHNGMLWVFDAVANSPRIFAFTWNDASETWEYTSSRDITATVHLTSNRARGIWSDGETIWVSHPGLLENDRRLYAYDLTSGSRVPANDYDVWEAAGVETSAGIWSDGETMWVVAKGTPSKVYAFDTFTKEHAPEKDISATNLRGDVRGIWSDGRTLWLSSKVGDHVYIHSYHMPVSANAQLTHLRVDGELVAGFAPDTTSYTVEVEPGVTVVTVAAATRHFQGDAVIASPADANSAMDGHQVPIPAEGAVVTITATAQDGTTATYTLNLRPRALSGDAALTALTVSSATLQPLFDGATEEYAAALGAGVRTVTVTATRSDGRASVEFLDDHDRSLSLVGGDEGVATHQFTLPIRGNAIKVRVESEDGTQHQTYRIALSYPPTAPANVEIQSGDRFLAVSWEAPSDRGTSPINSFDLRYIRSDASSKDDQHWTTLPNVWNRTTAGPWRYELASLQNGVSYDVQVRAVSAGNGAWSASRSATPSPPAGDDASLKALTIDSASAPAFSPASRSYIVGVSGSSSRVTLAATATHPNARISLGTGTDAVDADPALAGHQVLLPRDEAAEKTVTIAVTAADGVTTADYRVTVIRNSSVATGWRAEADLNVLAGNGVNKPTGIWADETLVWIADGEDARVYAFELPTGRRAPHRDIELHQDNQNPAGLWSDDDATLWVVDSVADQIFRYNLESLENISQTSVGATITQPWGIWGDSDSLLIGDLTTATVFFHTWMSGSEGAPSLTVDTSQSITLSGGHPLVRGIWANDSTIWVADRFSTKLFAFNRSDLTRDSSKDFRFASGNAHLTGLWSDGETMWVVDDSGDKVYAFNTEARPLTAPTNGAPAFAATEDGQRSVPGGQANADAGSPIVATDRDSDAVTFALHGADAASFSITSGGQLRTTTALDFNAKATYTFVVSVSDRKAGDGSSDMALDDLIVMTVSVQRVFNSNLSGLTLSPGQLQPPFSSGTTTYQASVAYGVLQITVTGVADDSTSSVAYLDENGDDLLDADPSADRQVRLDVGENVIQVRVTAEGSIQHDLPAHRYSPGARGRHQRGERRCAGRRRRRIHHQPRPCRCRFARGDSDGLGDRRPRDCRERGFQDSHHCSQPDIENPDSRHDGGCRLECALDGHGHHRRPHTRLCGRGGRGRRVDRSPGRRMACRRRHHHRHSPRCR